MSCKHESQKETFELKKAEKRICFRGSNPSRLSYFECFNANACSYQCGQALGENLLTKQIATSSISQALDLQRLYEPFNSRQISEGKNQEWSKNHYMFGMWKGKEIWRWH